MLWGLNFHVENRSKVGMFLVVGIASHIAQRGGLRPSNHGWLRAGIFAGLLGVFSITAQAQTTLTRVFGSGANQFSMEFVTIGNPNNAADTTGSPNPVGAVAYTYNLGKHEVSRDMVSKANAAGNLGLTLGDMSPHGGKRDQPAGHGDQLV